MEVEAGEGENPNRVVDNLDDLDRLFCKTLDELIALYKRTMIRAYQLKDSVDRDNDEIDYEKTARRDAIDGD